MSTARDEADRLRINRQDDADQASRTQPPPGQGAIACVGITTSGVANSVQTIAVIGTPDSGGFTLSGSRVPPGAFTTPELAFNCTASDVQAALAAEYVTGNVGCTGGPLPGTPIVVTWGGTLLNTSIANLSGVWVPDRVDDPKFEVRIFQVARGEFDYPTVANAFYRLIGQAVGGVEVDGGSAIFGTGDVAYAFNLGCHVPPKGTRVLYHWANARYVFKY